MMAHIIAQIRRAKARDIEKTTRRYGLARCTSPGNIQIVRKGAIAWRGKKKDNDKFELTPQNVHF